MSYHGLDVTTQAQILDLLMDLQARYGLAMLYVTHNLGVVAQICNRIGVMYAGQMVEVAPRHQIFKQPLHPIPRVDCLVPRISAPTRCVRCCSRDCSSATSCRPVVRLLLAAVLPRGAVFRITSLWWTWVQITRWPAAA